MIYVDFRTEVVEKLSKKFQNSGWVIKLYKEGYTANNKQELDFIQQTNIKYFGHSKDILEGDFIKMSKACVGGGTSVCRFEVKYLFDEYNREGWERVFKIADMNLRSTDNAKDSIGNIAKYDEINNILIARPLNYEKNKEALKGHIFRRVGDFAIVLYIRISDNKENLISCKVPRTDFEAWNISEDQAIDRALENSSMMYPAEIYKTSGQIIEDALFNIVTPFDIDKDSVGEMTTLTCTCFGQRNGAVVIFYPGIMEKFYKAFGNEEYYVVFTATTEFHLHRCSEFAPEQLLETLLDCNERFPEDTLSNMIFRYSSDKKELLPVSLCEEK
ncbi:MAG: hypothetical protein E7302_06510 [Butyrivibrio sp.]|nr:hypothetical protein [Butyrivibrio sp.]